MSEETKKIDKKKQAKIEADNLMEDATVIFEDCIKCGMCKGLCPVFKVLGDESVSPRGHSIILSDKVIDKAAFQCNLCKACEIRCPLGIKVCEGVLKSREAAVLSGKGLKNNKEMINNVRKNGNPFGKDIDKNSERLYGC